MLFFRPLTILEEIAEAMKMKPEKVKSIVEANRIEPGSLNILAGESENEELLNFIEDKGALSPAETVSWKLFREQFIKILSALRLAQVQILVLRFGLDIERKRTLQELSDILGITREGARLRIDSVLKRIECDPRYERLKDYFGFIGELLISSPTKIRISHWWNFKKSVFGCLMSITSMILKILENTAGFSKKSWKFLMLYITWNRDLKALRCREKPVKSRINTGK
jgi:hypothetical protein